MYPMKRNTLELRKYQEDACHVYNFEVDKLLHNHFPVKVFQVRSKQDRNAKKVIKAFFKDNTDVENKMAKHFLSEVAVLATVSHPYIMGMDSMGSFPRYFAYVMPFYEEGTLTKVLPSMHQEMSDEYFVQLCAGVNYLHNKKVAHRDLKTDNILITEKKVLIADFGLSDILPTEDTMATQRKGTVVYKSPEQFLKKQFNPFKCDMFALGVVYWCMVFKVNVLSHEIEEPMMETVRNRLSPSSIDRLILTNLLEYQPEERLSIFELLFLMEESCFSHRIAKLKEQRCI
nr:CBL-interacting serine/threonine-protein kinase 22-like [Biomphalaria glabrata]